MNLVKSKNPKNLIKLSIIIPTYNEAENIKLVVPRLFQTLNGEDINAEVIVVDDDSPDGTADVALAMADRYFIKVHVRKKERGLATAVMKGFELAKGDICVVIDADLSHPVEKIPEMIKPIIEGKSDVTVGSRYINGGGCENWPLLRRVISKGAGLLARGVTNLTDPTSGFMALRKSIIDGVKLDPVGWKIVLEVIVKTNSRFTEIPIVFADRQKGESKLNFKAQKDYLYHLWKLYNFKYSNIFQFIKFCIVGLSGLFIDTAMLVSSVEIFYLDPRFAAVFAFIVAVSWNYLFNRLWTFETAKYTKVTKSYLSFVSVCFLGLGIRIGIMHLLIEYAGMGKRPWYVLASFLGIVSATIFNFLGSKYVAFKNIQQMRKKNAK
jgi:dolichol-phosphate mannosyltransferase